MKLSTSHHKKVRIEMLPLIDVVFLLLVFFIYAMLSMPVHWGLAVDLPTSASTSIETGHALNITIDANGQIYVDQSPVLPGSFRNILSYRTKDLKNPLVLVSADGRVSYQQLFSVMDDIKASGSENPEMKHMSLAAVISISLHVMFLGDDLRRFIDPARKTIENQGIAVKLTNRETVRARSNTTQAPDVEQQPASRS